MQGQKSWSPFYMQGQGKILLGGAVNNSRHLKCDPNYTLPKRKPPHNNIQYLILKCSGVEVRIKQHEMEMLK